MKPNENFNSGRFMQYLAQDLKRCVRKAGLTTFACSLAPAIILAFTAWSSSMGGNTEWKIWLNFSDMAAAIISVLFFLRLPITCYGHLTDKRKGAAHLMLPVSHTEKYVSMILVGIVIFPLAFALMYLSVDALCNVLFPTRYEEALAIAMAQDIGDIHLLSMFFTPWMVSSAGLAGAVLFKKNKGAKTFFTAALSFIALLIILGTIERRCSIPSIFPYNIYGWYIFKAICTVLLMTYTYFKTKKIEL